MIFIKRANKFLAIQIAPWNILVPVSIPNYPLVLHHHHHHHPFPYPSAVETGVHSRTLFAR